MIVRRTARRVFIVFRLKISGEGMTGSKKEASEVPDDPVRNRDFKIQNSFEKWVLNVRW